MRSLLSRYLARIMLVRFTVLLLGLGALMMMLDFLSDGDKVFRASDDVVTASLRYAFLRLPEILSELIPFTALVAAVLSFVGLARHSELTVFQAAGVSKARLIVAVMPVAMLIAVFQFVIEDQALPAAVSELRAWGVGDYGDRGSANQAALTWLRQGNDIARVRHAAEGANGVLNGVTIFRRDDNGRLQETIFADRARFAEGVWTLYDITVVRPEVGSAERLERLVWPNIADPSVLTSLTAHPREMPLAEILAVSAKPGFGNRPASLYLAWAHERLARPITTITLVILAVALMQRFDRTTGGGVMILSGIGVGFLSWTFDGLVFSLGEYGLLPPVLAAWVPVGVFTALAAALTLQHERLKVPRPSPVAPGPNNL